MRGMMMKYEDKLRIGLAVDIEVTDGEYQGTYKSKIEEKGVRIISIGVPVADGQFVPLREGTRIKIVFSDEAAAYTFTTVLIRRIATPIPLLVIEYPANIQKIQRRQYVRVPQVMPIEYCILAKEGITRPKKAFTIDLSGGGLQFKAQENIPPESILIIKVVIGESKIELPANVTRSVKEEDREGYKISTEFRDITESSRDMIIRFVFDIQREMRKKGLI